MATGRLMVGVTGLGAALAVGLTALALILPADSEAQSGTMHNCPAPGKWSIAVWGGESGTAAADALASCGPAAVDAAYFLEQTGAWSRWFAGKPDVSNLPALDNLQGIITLGSATALAPGEASGPGAQPGAMQNCPPAGKWAISVWNGQNGVGAGQAFATCGAGAVSAAYSLDLQMGGWLRWFADKPDLNTMPPMNNLQGVVALGSATGSVVTPAPTPSPTPTPTATPAEPELGTWEGMTSKGVSIDFVVVGEPRAISRSFWMVSCFDAEGDYYSTAIVTFPSDRWPIVDNAFSSGGPNPSVFGRFDSTRTASGELNIEVEACGTVQVTWTASWTKPPSPNIYDSP